VWKQKLSALTGRLGLIILGLGLALIFLEVGFRILYPDPTPKLVNQGLQFHPVYGLAFTPHAEGWNTSLRGEYSTYIKINSKGLRGPEYPYQKPANTYRILVLGDSFTAALQVPEPNTFPKLLETHLRQQVPHTNIEVINAGVVGSGTDSQLAYYTQEGYKYQPDLVLLAFFTGNDITDNIWHSLYELQENELVYVPPIQRPGGIGQRRSGQQASLFNSTREFLYTHSRLYSVSIELLTLTAIQKFPPLVDLMASLGVVAVTRPLVNYGNFYAFRYLPQEAWDKTEALLVRLNQAVQAHNAQLVVTILPDESDVDEQRRAEIIKSYPQLTKEQALSGPPPSTQLAQILQQHKILHVELLPAFKARWQTNKQPLYYRYDGHWTPAGHRLAGQTIFDYLLQQQAQLLPVAE